MFKWVKKLLKGDAPTRSTKDGEELTDYETAHIARTGCCPDCGVGKLAGGPEGGGSQNCACAQCGSEFNWMGFMGGHRISNPGPRDLGGRAGLYGLSN